mgnify:CR=1 FL=1
MSEKELGLKILEYLGGPTNINSVFNCYTRVRAEVKDTKIVKTKDIEALGVIGVVIAGSQVQIVVGPGKSAKCSQAINAALNKSGVKTETPKNQKENKDPKAKGGVLKKISGIFVPIIPATIACGLVMAIIEVVKAATGGPSSTFPDSNFGLILNIIAGSVFTVFNFIVGYNTCKQFGGDGIIGACLAAILANVSLNDISFGSFKLEAGLGGIIAVVAISIGAAYFEKLLRKFMPNIIDAFMTPLITLVVMAMVGFFAIQPVCGYISQGIGLGVQGILEHCPYLLGIVPMFYLPMVLFGVHHSLMPISQTLIDKMGYSVLVPIQLMAGAAQVGAAIYFIISTKNKKARTTVIQGLPVGVLGIGEPLIYGMTLPLKRLFIPIGIAGAIAGGVMSVLDVRSPVAEATGIEASLVFTGDGKWKFALVYLCAVVLGFIMSALIGYKETYEEVDKNGVVVEKTHESSLVLKYWGFWKKEKPQIKKGETKVESKTFSIASPLKGKVVKLETLKDKTFSQKIMGDGIAIIPSEGKVYSPVDGKISALLDTKHAYGITSVDGYELLVHIGIDTVNLKGKGFKSNVKEGDQVKKGQLLGTFDIPFIKKKGYSIATPIIVVSGEKIIKCAKLGNITSKANLLTISK